jgi:PilZ domain-containing protein
MDVLEGAKVMEPHYPHQRREVRFVIEAGATVEVGKNGQTIHATTVNMSGGGVLLHFEESVPLAVGDQVSCEFKVEHGADSPLPYWGLGEVVRVIEGCSFAIVLKAGGFSPLESGIGSAAQPESNPDAP